MKLYKSKKMISVWGCSEPKQLLEISSYLNAHGFVGPTSTSTVYLINFCHAIDDDLEFWCSINRVGGDPSGNAIYFDVRIGLQSRSLLQVTQQVKLFQQDFTDSTQYAETIFSVSLSHLKWNAIQSDENPCWKVSKLASFSNEAFNWIKDWEKYVVPLIMSVRNMSGAIELGRTLLRYQKNPWVKSDGWNSAALVPFLAILMFKNGQSDEARELLDTASSIAKRVPEQMQLQLISDWISSNSTPVN